MVQKAKNARARFEAAALALFEELGVAGATVSDIAARAQLTERTFYRYFTDKREVLFGRASELEARVVDAIQGAPADTAPLAVVIGALEAVADFFDGHRATVKQRLAIVAAHPEFLERETLKMGALTTSIRQALETRRVEPSIARIASEASVSIARVALESWVNDPSERGFAHHVQASRLDLEAVVLKDRPR